MLENIYMIYAGDPGRGKRFQQAAKGQGWRIHIGAGPEQAIACCLQYEPDLVIIDDFPESEQARMIFYQLRAAGKGPFLVLNDSPGSLKYSRLGALSFIRMITRDPEPVELKNAIVTLIESNREYRRRRNDRSTPSAAVGRRTGRLSDRPAG